MGEVDKQRVFKWRKIEYDKIYRLYIRIYAICVDELI